MSQNFMSNKSGLATGVAAPTYAEASKTWWRIGFLSFGGPAAQIALMHREIVDEKSWLTERQFLNALSFCMLLPGPEAMQLATYAGWRLHGVLGGLMAGIAFVLPGALVMLGLAAFYLLFGQTPLVEALFVGIKAAVLVIVLQALAKVSAKALHRPAHWIIAALAFVGIFFLDLPFPLIILVAAFYGFLHEGTATELQEGGDDDRVTLTQTGRTIALWLVVWLSPLLLLYLADAKLFADIGAFFAKLAMVTFGGAYAVLAYMAQDAVEMHGWLSAAEMMDGLGLAETTPGPLILVTEFVGFLAAARAEGGASIWLGLLGVLVTLWMTFAPCFLWIFAGAPYIEWISARPRLREALTAITAAVVGVILNLSIWFALHVLFTKVETVNMSYFRLFIPELNSLDPLVLILSLFAAALIFWRKWGMLQVLAVCSVSGFLMSQ